MTAQDFTVELFCRVDDTLKGEVQHPLATLHPSEVVTLGMLQALRREGPAAFYRWVCKELESLFPRLPSRTRLGRLLEQHEEQARRFLAEPTLFGVCDSFGIELVHPWREKRSQREVARKGKSLHRWIVGAKVAVVLNSRGQVCDFAVDGANVHDTRFHPLIETFQEKMIVLADRGFKAKEKPIKEKKPKGTPRRGKNQAPEVPAEAAPAPPANPTNLKVCPKGQWNERMIVETVFSLWTVILGLKKLSHRKKAPLQARLAYTCAVFNLCLNWSGEVKLELAPFAL